MGEYLNFINEYSTKFNFDLQYNDFVSLKAYISNAVEEILSFRGVKVDNMEALVYFTMCFLLSNHTAKEILTDGYANDIEKVVEKVYTKQNEAKPKEEQVPYPEKNEAVDYIFKDLKGISYIFKEGLNLGQLSKNIKDSLVFEGYKEEDILEGKCDEVIIDYLAKGYFDVRYTEDFKNMRVAVSNMVVTYFNHRKKDARYYTNRDNFEYIYFNSRSVLNNVIFKLTMSFLDNKVNPRKLNTSSPEMEVVYNYVQKDMIRINSTRVKYKPETELEKWRKLSREEKQERLQRAKKAAIVFAIIFGLMAVENLIYNSIHNKGNKQERSRYNLETNAYDIDRVSHNIEHLRYNPGDNTVILPQEISVENAPIDETIEENFKDEMEGEQVARL